MNRFRCCSANLLLVLLLVVPLSESCAAKPAGGGGKGGGGKGGSKLSITTNLSSESGVQPGIAEGNEILTYSIVVNNSGRKDVSIDVTETVPPGTSYVGGDDFAGACVAGDVAGTSCQLTSVIPGQGSSTLSFIVKVANPVATLTIDNNVTTSAIDCASNDCTESMPTTGIGSYPGLDIVSPADWTDTSVRKVLHAFAYAGLTTDAQIAAWAAMSPDVAIQQMLTFNYNNELLSPSEDASGANATSLEALQAFWGGDDATNPMRWDRRRYYRTLELDENGLDVSFSRDNMQRTWIQAVNARGINPFLHKVGFFLTNYHMAIRANLATNGLFRSYYDQAITDLVSGQPFTTIIANAAKSAATAKRYGHNRNIYNIANRFVKFQGNDDFAREFFQLFFRYNGVDETIEYHESVNIENNAQLLTGMEIDHQVNAYNSDKMADRWIAPIIFTDHVDDVGRDIPNVRLHHQECLEIFHQMICGATASEKIDALAEVAAVDAEVRTGLPAYIISYFADDQLTSDKITKIAEAWWLANDDLLTFMRSYAISKMFHSETTVKFRSTFDRNLTLYNTVVLDNEESFIGRLWWESPRATMISQGGEVFLPEHDVFGGQTGTEASGNPGIFKNAYNVAVLQTDSGLSRTTSTYFTDNTQTSEITWDKNWGAVIPTNGSGEYIVGEVADWLWRRIVGDGGKNFDVIARSQVIALLARGEDFGYAVTQLDSSISSLPETTYSSSALTGDARLVAVMAALEAETMQLASDDITGARRAANTHVTNAVSFISMLPYTFALEGK